MYSSKGYPAHPQTNSKNPLELAVNQAEIEAYLVRLREDTFFQVELDKCQDLDSVLQLQEKREKSIKKHDNGIKIHEALKLRDYEFYSDADDYPGTAVAVLLDIDDHAGIIKKQKRNSYKIETHGEIFTQEEWEAKEKSIIDLEEIKNVVEDTREIYTEITKEIREPLENTSESNTSYLYELAEKQRWKLMLGHNGYVLPGHADPHPTCGKWRFSKCLDHNYGKRSKHSCNRLACSYCVRQAGAKIAKKIEKRIWLWKLMTESISNNRKNPKPSHVIESIPAGDIFWTYHKSKQQRIKKDMRKIAGIKAGVSISHNWRFEQNKTEPYLSIHDHLICFGWISQTAAKDIFQKYGINVVYHKPKSGTLHKRKNVFSVAFYLLSHASIKNNKHSVHWFGELSYRKVSNQYLARYRDLKYVEEDEAIEKSKSCVLCGLRLMPAKIDRNFKNWANYMPDGEEQMKGCMFMNGLLLSLDLVTEKMEFYTDDYDVIHHKTRKELLEEQIARRPDMYGPELVMRRQNQNQTLI